MSHENDSSEFYIGYEPVMPRGIARRARRAVLAGGICAVVTTAIVLAAQHALPDAAFEFGRFREYTGVITLDPYPQLLVSEGTGTRGYWLAGPGKHGGERLASAWDGRTVRLGAALIERGRRRMLEIRPGSVRAADNEARRSGRTPSSVLGAVTLRGEIVDSKCFLGVMNPSEGAVHRDCAVACLRGGLPPMLRVRNQAGRETLVVLVSVEGASASGSLAALAGRPVEAQGMLVHQAGDYVLRVESVSPLR